MAKVIKSEDVDFKMRYLPDTQNENKLQTRVNRMIKDDSDPFLC